MKRILSKLLGGALLFGLTMSLTSCEDILGHWEKPTPNPITPGGGTATVTSISIDATLSINVGNADVTLTATVDPAGTAVTWSSDNTAAATVDETGKVHAVAAGSAKITARAGDKEAVCNVTVTAYTMAAKAASADKGKLICTDGHIHAYGEDAECTKDRVALICYVGNDAETSTTYNHGLALALSDVSSSTYTWCSQNIESCLGTGHQFDSEAGAKGDLAGIANTDALVNNAPAGHTHAAASEARNYNSGTHPTGTSAWFLPSAGQWDKMATAAGGYGTLKTNAGLQSNFYWSSSERSASHAWNFYSGNGSWSYVYKSYDRLVRACLAF